MSGTGTSGLSGLSPSEINLLLQIDTEDVKKIEVNDIIDNSDNFSIKFPVDTVRLRTLKNKKNIPEEYLRRNINSVYPFIHENVLKLYAKFLNFKRTHGSAVEKEFYKDLGLKEFVNRLLKKRAVMFIGKYDKYLLVSGEMKGSGKWETIGTDREKAPLILKNCLSYDEIKLSAFLYASSYTYFVNLGHRKNKAVYSDDRSKIQDEGIIAGMIGPRLKKSGVMDYQEIVITSAQNQESNGYGNSESVHKLFADFFGEENLTYKVAVQRKSEDTSNRYTNVQGGIFDNRIYEKRLAVVFDCLLLEANHRAKEAGTTAYIHVVGLGLGVWKISGHQEKVFMDSFYNRII